MKYQVLRGAIMAQINGKRTPLAKGEIVPEGALSEKNLAGYLADGCIGEFVERPEELEEPVRTKGKWLKDPSSLVGMDMETLLTLVLEVDEDYDVSLLQDEAACVRQLSADWQPSMSQRPAVSGDRSEVLNLLGSEEELQRARELAQG